MVNSDIGLDDFGTEPGGIGSDLVLVGDVLARGIPIRWDEAVALLQEMLDVLIETGGNNATIPGFADVVIDKQGGLKVQSTRRGERGPVAAGRALHALLATADVPVPLRLFVTQANAPETHGSLQAFADGLAYFGKPGRADLIRGVYERYRASGPPVAATPSRTDVPAEKSVRADHPQSSRRTLPPWLKAAAVVVAIVGVGAVLWLGVFGGSSGGGTSVVAQAKAAIDKAKSALEPASPKAGTTQGSSKTSATRAEKPEPAARSGAQSAAARKAAPSDLRVSTRTDDRRAARPVEPAVTLPRPSQLQTPGPAAAAVSVVPATREYVVAPREDPTIYSPSDADVQPPTMIYPSLPPPVFIAKDVQNVLFNRMELVIAADGSVERVRLVNGPGRMPDMMLLSGAKLWKFSPAVKDGVPVRYRTTVTWTAFP